MLSLKKVMKDYIIGETKVKALDGINLEFRKNEFVSILGQSGCGKTTLLNLIGGLDRYTSGDIIIDNISTKNYSDMDWDSYRNNRIGFIFQSYNLIAHIDILHNVEMALTLSGIGKKERQQRAMIALEKVGLADQINKKPNQLSGGQMQRVSIARALVNNPDIILADEPTGALDSVTSLQVMDILKEIASDKLVIMVTHNGELAKKYSTRIVKLSDGKLLSDSMPFDSSQQKQDAKHLEISQNKINKNQVSSPFSNEVTSDKLEKQNAKKQIKIKKEKAKKSSMNFWTAIYLSFQNLMTKKGRTFMTSFAGSIGIIGVALVLAISNGFSGYIKKMQQEVLASYPVTIATQDINTSVMMASMMGKPMVSDDRKEYPIDKVILPFNPMNIMKDAIISNNITQEYVDYVEQLKVRGLCSSIGYNYAVDMKVIGKINNNYKTISNELMQGTDFSTLNTYQKVNLKTNIMQSMTSGMNGSVPNINWQEMQGDREFILSQYEVLQGQFPTNKNQLALVVSKSNQISEITLASMGLDYKNNINFDEVLDPINGLSFKLATNNVFYKAYGSNNKFQARDDLENIYNSQDSGVQNLSVTCILRPRSDAKLATLSTGVAYLPELTQYVIQDGMNSDIVLEQLKSSTSSVLVDGKGNQINFSLMEQQRHFIAELGGSDVPSLLNIYPNDFASKEIILSYLDEWNVGKSELSKIKYTDLSQLATDMISETVKIISIVLICFAAISLIVSSIMIGIITFVSVVERTKEIGILRSLGARKFDISNVFNAETSMIGLASGLIGVIVTYLLCIPINFIIFAKIQVANLCLLSPLHALLMVAISLGLTFIAGLIPAAIASNKDPVVALRTE